MYTRHEESSAVISARPESVFAALDDHARLSSHMSRSSWQMGGGKMQTIVDRQQGRSVGSHIILQGSVLGISLFVEEAVTLHGILSQTVAAAEILEKQGVSSGVYSFPTIKPLDVGLIRRLARELPLLVTVEEHTNLGGLGGAVAETVGDMSGNRARVMRLGMRDTYSTIVGSQQYLREQYGLDFKSIAETTMQALKEQKL
jgi:transketolase C-terminal domain/subunit